MINAVDLDFSNVCSVYILRGSDAYLKDGVVKKLKNLIDLDTLDINYSRFDEDAKISGVVGEAVTVPFIGERKVLYFRAPQKITDEDKQVLADYSKSPCQSTVLILDDPAANLKFLEKYAQVVQCQSSSLEFTMRWIKNTLSVKGFTIEPQAMQALANYSGNDLMRVSVELKKLIGFSQSKVITFADVNDCVVPSLETHVFELTDSLAKRDNKNSVAIYNKLMARGESPAFLLSIITSQFRRILHVMLSNLSDQRLAALLKTKEYPIVLARRMSKNFTSKKVKNILDVLTNNEFLFKSGVIGERTAFDLSFAYLLAK